MQTNVRPLQLASTEDDDPIAPLHAPNLEALGIAHGFFTRRGGVSGGIYRSLNCGRGSRDNRADVEENRARVAARLGIAPNRLIGPRQAHTPHVVIVKEPFAHSDAPEADAIVTSARGIAVSVLTADCAPILLADAEMGIIAAVHSGWRGAKAGVIESALAAMTTLGARLERIAAAIGPAISRASYEVGPEFREAFISEAESNAQFFTTPKLGARPHFDLPAFVRDRLASIGVADICDLALCTYENESILFSHRRSIHRGEPDYGRQISAILLP